MDIKSIAKGTMTGLSLIVSIINIVDFSVSMSNKYRKHKTISGFDSNNETSAEG